GVAPVHRLVARDVEAGAKGRPAGHEGVEVGVALGGGAEADRVGVQVVVDADDQRTTRKRHTLRRLGRVLGRVLDRVLRRVFRRVLRWILGGVLRRGFRWALLRVLGRVFRLVLWPGLFPGLPWVLGRVLRSGSDGILWFRPVGFPGWVGVLVALLVVV